MSIEIVALGFLNHGIDQEQRDVVIDRLASQLGVDVKVRTLWDDPVPNGFYCPDGWKRITKYVGDRVCIMFFDGACCMWKFESGYDLLCVLEACPAMEFYVCDESASYLLCSNHHDYIIGWGAARSWVDALAQ